MGFLKNPFSDPYHDLEQQQTSLCAPLMVTEAYRVDPSVICQYLVGDVTSTIVSRRLRLFGHIARADPSQDHSRALQAAINRLPIDWRRRRGRPRRTWLRTIESDLQPTNLGLNSAWLRAQDRSRWRSVVETAMLTAGRAT